MDIRVTLTEHNPPFLISTFFCINVSDYGVQCTVLSESARNTQKQAYI